MLNNPVYFVASLPRSGTSSICAMAARLGLRHQHTAFDLPASLAAGVRFFADTPFHSPTYLAAALQFVPHAKVIYLTRPLEDVEKSLASQQLLDLYTRRSPGGFHNWIDALDIACWDHVRDPALRKLHHQRILDLCKNLGRPTLDYSFSDGWEPLCRFVDHPGPIPTEPVPHLVNPLV